MMIQALCLFAALANAQPMEAISAGAADGFFMPAIQAFKFAPTAAAMPVARRNNQQNMALHKIKLNPDQDKNDVLFAKLEPGLDVYAVVKELYEAGFKVQSYADGAGYYYLAVDVAGADAADQAIGLAKYYYVTEVQVGKKVYDAIFPPTNP